MGQAERPRTNAKDSGNRADAGFKPVALPALAAAVKAAKPKPQETPHRELPAILRKDAS